MNAILQWSRRAALAFLLWAACSSEASACATCFGQTDSPLGRGLNWGILALLVTVNGVLVAICSFFVFVARRAARIEAEEQASAGSGAPAHNAQDSSQTL